MSRLRLLTAAVLLGSLAQAADDGVTIDREKKSVAVDAKIAPRKIDAEGYKDIYPIEVIASWPFPRGKKAHETVVTIEAKPSAVHKALEAIGLKAGAPVMGDSAKVGSGSEVKVFIEVPGDDRPRRLTMDKVLLDPKSNKPFPKDVKFLFTGSVQTKPNPDKSDTIYGADASGTLIAIYPVTDQTALQTSLTMKDEKFLKLETNKAVLPKEGSPVKLVIEAVSK